VELTKSEVDRFLAERHTVIVATIRRDGTAHLTTTWYRWDGEAFWISTNRDRTKFKNLRRDRRLSLLVDDAPLETSVAAYGEAEFAAFDDAAYEGALAIVRRYVDDPEGYLAERDGEPRVLIRMRPERLVTWKPDA
jgi:PPOX class probable F420-dependent enzyme